jgi:DNA-binding response OmpR family regulator
MVPTTIPSVLIVEDERPAAELLRAVLSPHYSCAIAGSLTEALELARKRSFNLLLVNRELPDGSGPSLIALLRTTSPQTGAFVLCDRVDEEIMAEAIQAGALELLRKPVNLIRLLNLMESAMAFNESSAA